MKRYKVVGIEPLSTIRLCLSNRQMNESEKKYVDVSIGDMLSILYIDNLSMLGKGKEYVIHCRINEFVIVDNSTKHVNPDQLVMSPLLFDDSSLDNETRFFLTVDASTDYKSKILRLDVRNILDIHEYRYEYDLEESPTIIPKTLKEGVFVEEIRWPQTMDVTIPNDPMLGDSDFSKWLEEDLDE